MEKRLTFKYKLPDGGRERTFKMLTQLHAEEILESNEVPIKDRGEMELIKENNLLLYDAYMELNKIANGESGQFDTHVSWRPCPVCKSNITYNKQTTTPEHNAECDTCGYMVFFSVDMNENDARKLWNKLVAN